MKTIDDYFKDEQQNRIVKEIYEKVLSENDISQAGTIIQSYKMKLKMLGYSKKTDENYSTKNEEDEKWNPFYTIEKTLEKDKEEIFTYKNTEELEVEDVLEYFKKIARRSLLNTIQYRVSLEFLRKEEMKAENVISTLSDDEENITNELYEEFEVFVDAGRYYGQKVKELTEKIFEEDYFSKIEPEIIDIFRHVYSNVIIGGITGGKINDLGEKIEMKLGFYGILNENFICTLFNEKKNELDYIKEDNLGYSEKLLKESLRNARRTIIEKDPDQKDRLDKYIEDKEIEVLKGYI